MSTTEAFVIILLGAIAVGLSLYCLRLRGSVSQLRTGFQELRGRYDEDAQKWNQYSAAMKAELERVSKWTHVADADAKAQEMLQQARENYERQKLAAAELVREAEARASELRQDAKLHLEAARAEGSKLKREAKRDADARAQAAEAQVKEILSEARQKAKNLKTVAEERFEAGTRQAAEIIEHAHNRARDIAGDAYDVVKNVKRWEAAATAMRNTIMGYGREYLLPETSLLDDLAEEYGHAEAGKDLKRARDLTRSMVTKGTAAECDDTDPQRRESATRFVLDAFNGKVDAIVSKVKNDNAGKLQQEVKDAFTLVNFHGLAFRNARITEQYLEARLKELKLASTVQFMKLHEREEQRQIREQIREEEKARREYERALKEAAKEEDMLRKAMQKAQRQVADATLEQKAMYEAQLQELMQKLKEAEEKGQRAMSMAQQTKRGHVYIISNIGSFGEQVYKIGLTRRLEPQDRIRELGDASVPFEFDIHAMIWSKDAPELERRLHKHFVMSQINKVNHRKEFFRANLKDIREQIEQLGVEAKWTMTAEARQFRESQAIEDAIAKDPSLREVWLSRQLELDPVVFEVDSEDELEADIVPVKRRKKLSEPV